MAGRNNILIKWIGLSFDTFNLLHRWFGRIVVLEAVAHTVAWIAATLSTGGWAAVRKSITGDGMIMYGFIVSVPVRAILPTLLTLPGCCCLRHHDCTGELHSTTRFL